MIQAFVLKYLLFQGSITNNSMGLQPSGEQQTKALASALIHILIQVCSMAVFPKFLLMMVVQFCLEMSIIWDHEFKHF